MLLKKGAPMSDNQANKIIHFFWNGKRLSAVKGSNLLQAALDNGLDIPHFCHHKELFSAGACRMCLVEIESGNGELFPSCQMNAEEGLRVRSDTHRVKNAIKWSLKFHLREHPLDCPACDKGGECSLQEAYMRFGLFESPAPLDGDRKNTLVPIGDRLMLNEKKCILCTRCIRFLDHVTGTSELGAFGSGKDCKIVAYKSVDNDYSLNLVDLCPVGAMVSRDFHLKQKVWLMNDVETICIGCETSCSIKVSQNRAGVYRIRPAKDPDVNPNWICDYGRSIFHHITATDRLHGPMKSVNGRWETVGYDNLPEIIGKKNVKFILNSSLTNEEVEAVICEAKPDAVALYNLPNEGDDFDGLLQRSKKNINWRGVHRIFEKANIDHQNSGLEAVVAGLTKDDIVFLVVPELIVDHDHFATLVERIQGEATLIGLTTNYGVCSTEKFEFLFPLPTFLEKSGTIKNYKGLNRCLRKGENVYGDADRDLLYYSKVVRDIK
jgi:NADH-quinone oxidoreductase subunit G